MSGGYALVVVHGIVSRRRHGLPGDGLAIELGKVAGLAVVAALLVYWSNTVPRRGVPFAGVLVVLLLVIWTFVSTRTTFGRHVYAVGATPRRPGARGST